MFFVCFWKFIILETTRSIILFDKLCNSYWLLLYILSLIMKDIYHRNRLECFSKCSSWWLIHFLHALEVIFVSLFPLWIDVLPKHGFWMLQWFLQTPNNVRYLIFSWHAEIKWNHLVPNQVKKEDDPSIRCFLPVKYVVVSANVSVHAMSFWRMTLFCCFVFLQALLATILCSVPFRIDFASMVEGLFPIEVVPSHISQTTGESLADVSSWEYVDPLFFSSFYYSS